MADIENGAVVPGNNDGNGAPLIPGRQEVLKQFAGEVLAGGMPPEAKAGDPNPPGIAEAGKTAVVLSQDDQSKGTEDGKSGRSATEPTWNAEQTAWFAAMDAATTEEAKAALTPPAFSEAELAWLENQELAGSETGAPEDHLADDAELKGKLDAGTQERINKRIGKEVAKTKAALEQVEQLTAKAAELEAKLSQAPRGPDVPTGIYSMQDLQTAEASAREAFDQASDLLGQIETDPEAVEAALRAAKFTLKGQDGTEDFSPAAMRRFLGNIRNNADRKLRKELPKAVGFLKQVDASAGEAFKAVPELRDPRSPKRAEFDAVVKQWPAVKQFPNWPYALAMMLESQAALKARSSGNSGRSATAATKAKRPIPTMIPSPRGVAPVAPRPRPAASAASEDLGERALGGDKKARLQYIQSLMPKT